MEKNILLNLTLEEYKLVIGCLLTTKETFKMIPIKNSNIKNKIVEIDKFLKKYNTNNC